MKILGNIFLILLAGVVLLVIRIGIGLDSSHDNTLGFLELPAMLLVPALLIAATARRKKRF